jgi:methyltransferase-like protein/SAM-dependent methyltransferase
LATVARIFGLCSPDVAGCRVLELGCASGGNLIPMAFNLPGSEFVGVDLSQHQVDDAHAAIGALGLRNIRIEHASILDIDRDWGAFDYIICHGVFSWVDAAVQDKILQICADNLAGQGIAYVSYNTYPGWHMREMVRHMMRYHAQQFDEAGEQVEQARALLKFLASASQDSGAYGQLLSREAERLGVAPDSYLYHEHLERTNVPLYFHEFIDRAEHVGLQFLSEAAVRDMLTAHLPADVAATLERISPDILHLEQYMDFVRHRQFRQTLLCHDALRPKRALSTDCLHGLMMSSRVAADVQSPDLTAGTTVVFTTDSQRANVASPATKAALTVLLEQWPQAIDVEELCTVALERASPFLVDLSSDDARRAMLEDLLGAVMYGMITLHSQPPSCTNTPSDIPRAHSVAAQQAEVGDLVVNAHHEMVQLGPLEREVLKLCNGHRSRRDIVDVLVGRFEGDTLTLEDAGKPVTEPDVARAMLSHKLETAIRTLTRSAVLVD